jgi:four helix bundle protein
MAATRGFETLDVYRLSERLADAIWDVVLSWQHFAKNTVGTQLVRAADSVGANIAEGTGRQSFNDNRRFVRIARGLLNEPKHFLRRAYKRRLLSQATINTLKPLMDELAPRLNAYLRSIGRDHASMSARSTSSAKRKDADRKPQGTRDKGQGTKTEDPSRD